MRQWCTWKKQIYQSKHLHHQTGCTLAYKDMGVKLSLEAAAVGTQLDDGWNLYDPGLLAHPHASDKPDQLNETKTQQSKEAMSSWTRKETVWSMIFICI